MSKPFKAALLGVAAVLSLVPGAAWSRDTVSDDAIAAIALPEQQLRQLLARTVFATQSMGMAAYTLGIPEACQVVRPAFETAVSETLPKWRQNLVRAYRDRVPADVLARATNSGLGEAAGLTFLYLPAIGQQMQQKSEPLLRAAALKVVTSAIQAAASKGTHDVNSEKRVAELKQAQADGSLYCGLQPTRSGN